MDGRVISPPALSAPSLSTRSDSWTQQSRNPVSVRLYKVLGTNYDDEGTKQALHTLSDFYAPPPPPAGTSLSSRLDEDDENDWDDEETTVMTNTHVRAMSGTSTSGTMIGPTPVVGELATRARNNMRRDVERRLTEGSRKFLEAFREVDQNLDVLQTQISDMRLRCTEAETQLAQTSESCDELLDRAGNLRKQRLEIVNKQSIVSLFLSRFTLSDDEVEAISSRDIPVSARFFASMDKTRRIRDDCRVLMAGEEGPTKAGLDIMAATATYLEQGFDKVSRWCILEFRQMGRDAQLEVSNTLREAVAQLRQRPELLTEALAVLAQTRASALLSSFLDALTRGGPGGLPRPIELHAHDPLRYVGDMLAWVHQAIAAEAEFVEALFTTGASAQIGRGASRRRMVGEERRFGDGPEEGWTRDLMDGAVARLCGPLKARVQQTVRAQESSITSYKIANLLQFYMITMRRTLGADAVLPKTLHEITDMAFQVFFDTMEAQGRSLLRLTLDFDDTDVTPPPPILDHVQTLRDIMTVYGSSLGDDDVDADQDAGFQKALDATIDPALEMCVAAAEEKKRVRPTWDAAVFVINCLTYLQAILEQHPFAVEKRKMIEGVLQGKVDELVEEHFHNILIDAGLSDVAATLEVKQNEPLSRLPATQPTALQHSLRTFAQWLQSIEVVHSPRLALLSAQGLHSRVHRAALARLARVYRDLCTAVRAQENRYEAAATLLGQERPFGQIGMLCQIFGLSDTDLEDS